MAGVRFSAQTAEITTGTTLKTVLMITAAANVRVLVREVSVSFKGVTSTDAPILVQVLRFSTAGTFTSLTPVKNNDGDDETLQVTAGHTATAEPTPGDVLVREEVHPQGGAFLWQATYGDEFVVKGGSRLGVSVTAGASTSCVARIRGEE